MDQTGLSIYIATQQVSCKGSCDKWPALEKSDLIEQSTDSYIIPSAAFLNWPSVPFSNRIYFPGIDFLFRYILVQGLFPDLRYRHDMYGKIAFGRVIVSRFIAAYPPLFNTKTNPAGFQNRQKPLKCHYKFSVYPFMQWYNPISSDQTDII